MRKRSILVPAVLSVTLLAGATGAAAAPVPRAATVPSVAAAKPKVVDASAVLRALVVRPESHANTYKRSYFKLWVDADKDGCNTRQEVLIAESTVKVHLGPKCKILSGKWYSYYDGVTTTNPSTFDIDHVVPLAEAWKSGAWQWKTNKKTAIKLEHYANDLGFAYTLQAVTATSNRAKGDKDPDQWLPPRTAGQCTYAIRWVLIKWRWGLTLEATEKAAIAKEFKIQSCGNVKVALPAKGA